MAQKPVGPPSLPDPCVPAEDPEKVEEKPTLLISGTSRLYVAPPYNGPSTFEHMQNIYVKKLTPGYESYYQSDIRRAAANALGKADFQANLANLCDMASAEIQGNGAAMLPYLSKLPLCIELMLSKVITIISFQ